MGEPWRGRFDAVVGNPPFLNQLERATVRRTPLPPALDAIARPYTDTAWLFLVVARDLVRAGGRVVLVQPQSLVAARDAAPVRDIVGPSLEGLWWCDELLFDASVRVCAPVLGSPGPSRAPVVRACGVRDRGRRPAALVVERARPVRRPRGPTPCDARASDHISVVNARASQRWATSRPRPPASGTSTTGCGRPSSTSRAATCRCWSRAGWSTPDASSGASARRGSADAGSPTRGSTRRELTGSRRVDGCASGSCRRSWSRRRRRSSRPRSTSTGDWVPSTPVISVHAAPTDLWRVAAVLTAPGRERMGVRHHAGAALAPDAIKLSARQVLEVPLPADTAAWHEGAEALAAGRILDAGRAMSRRIRHRRRGVRLVAGAPARHGSALLSTEAREGKGIMEG